LENSAGEGLSVVTLFVAPSPPVMNPISNQNTDEDTTKIINFVISDPDSVLDCSNSISVASSSPVSSISKGGTAPNCTLTVVPVSNLNASSPITVTVSDGELSSSRTFNFTVNPIDDAPVTSQVSQTINEDVATVVTLSYTDIENDSATTCALSNPSNVTGTCACTSGVCSATVTGNLNYNGSASFNYTVTANGLTSNSSLASLTITPVNDAPVLGAISAQSMTENTSLAVTLSVSDVDNAVTCTSFVSATSSNTTLVPNANIVSGGSAPGCTLTLTPVTAQTGSAIITVTATDGLLPSVQTFTLTVNPNIVTITQYATYRGWSDGTFARTCYEYRYPAVPYQYTGATGDSTATASTFYRIDPDGAGPIDPLNVSCDMTRGGWTSINALSTATTGYSRNGIQTSTDLVTSNSAAYTAIANLSTLQTVNYSVNFNGAATMYSCPYLGGQRPVDHTTQECWYSDEEYYWAGYPPDECNPEVPIYEEPCGYWAGGNSWADTASFWYPWITVNSSGTTSPQSAPFDCHLATYYGTEDALLTIQASMNYRNGKEAYAARLNGTNNQCLGGYAQLPYINPRADLITTTRADCSVTVRFLNSGTTVVHTPVTSQANVSSSTSATFNLNGSGGVRKIQTQTTCTGSGGNTSNGVNFNNTTVKLGGLRSVVSVAAYNTLKASFIDCGQSQQPFSSKVEHCAQVNSGATVDAGGGKIWKLVTKIGSNELWMDDSTGLVWSPAQVNKIWRFALTHCSELSAYNITGETWYLPHNAVLTAASSNGYANFISNASAWHWSSNEANQSNAWVMRWSDGTLHWGMGYKANSNHFRCVFSSRD
jgi:hypothetical protein